MSAVFASREAKQSVMPPGGTIEDEKGYFHSNPLPITRGRFGKLLEYEIATASYVGLAMTGLIPPLVS